MKLNILKIITCPYHSNIDFDMSIKEEHNDEIIEGVLICPECNRKFKITDGIPIIVPDDFGYDKNWKPGARYWDVGGITKLLSRTKKRRFEIDQDKLSLDIGCGEYGEGGVNIDVYFPAKPQKNFILASAELLPFKDKSFDIVKSSYVIEHLLSPKRFIIENCRISKNEVIIITDNSEWVGDLFFRFIGTGRIFHDEHCYRWTVEYLQNLIKRLGFKTEVKACNFSPSFFVRLVFVLGKLPRIGVWFCRDIYADIKMKD